MNLHSEIIFSGQSEFVPLSFDQRLEPSRRTIMVIDDDCDHCALISALLRTAGYRVISSVRVKDALGYFEKRHIDLVISDIMMPIMDGMALVSSIRSMQNNLGSGDCPIILVSSGPEEMEEDCLTQGADMFCPKKYLRTLLLKQVRFLLS